MLDGLPALSEFRRASLANKIGAKDVKSKHLHYVALTHVLDTCNDTEKETLYALLNNDEMVDGSQREFEEDPGKGRAMSKYWISPRMGTMSPWSSKATSIARNTPLGDKIKRIERGSVITIWTEGPAPAFPPPFADELYDRMTQTLSPKPPDLEAMFAEHAPAPLKHVSLNEPRGNPKELLKQASRELGLALDDSEIDYLVQAFGPGGSIARDPTDVELFMFAQVNSEHCRHKQFNAQWTIDGVERRRTLFGMIRSTHQKHPNAVISAYSDNAAVMEGSAGTHFAPDVESRLWTHTKETVHYLAKVETHNHPTAVSPYPGAATGSGGEIRDEGAVGRGSKPKAGLCGFTVSDLLIPGFEQPWELDVGKPDHIASGLEIMIEAPIGSASFNNEFGRPCTAGYFRTLLTKVPNEKGQTEFRGYHKPIMIAGGVGTVRPTLALKDPRDVSNGSLAVVLGGPAMLIGLGGGAASSVSSGAGSADLDFASVQRGNAEVQRRAQEVINACAAMGTNSPIRLIHDVGAGGLSNALSEIVHDAGYGATFELRAIDNADRGMSPMQIWCCEAQERYVLLIAPDGLETFKEIAARERCGYSVVGKTTGGREEEKRLVLLDQALEDAPLGNMDITLPLSSSRPPQSTRVVDMPMSVLFGKPPKMSKNVVSRQTLLSPFDASLASYLSDPEAGDVLKAAVQRVLNLPSVGSKSFLITIGDRTVGGLTARDQMVGPWQVPVADVSVTATSLTLGMKTGEAMAMGERPTLALISPAASARMAVAEALTNIAAADVVDRLDRIRLSANWMSASSHPGEGAAIYQAVEAIAMDMCPKLGISIPVGKDSMSMKMRWSDPDTHVPKEVTAPLSLIISTFTPVQNIHRTWTPTLRRLEDVGETVLLFVDLAYGRKALGGSALAQVFGQVGNEAPDVRDVLLLKDFFDALGQLQEAGIVLAYHDRSDGGLFATLVEMMFAGRCGVEIMLDPLCAAASTESIIQTLFNEELGAVFQVRKSDETEFERCFSTCGPPPGLIKKIGRVPPTSKQELVIHHGPTFVYRESRAKLQQMWAKTSYHMQRLRDNPACADGEHAAILEADDPGLSYSLTFDPSEYIMPRFSNLLNQLSLKERPRVAILREQGVNGHAEMAFAFQSAGFAAIDVHMTDLLAGRVNLRDFRGLAACGGFSYGDVLGAGQGWAKSAILNQQTREQFTDFFHREDTFTLGVCNGCQFLTAVRKFIPGTEGWPSFVRNTSEQYEARLSMVQVHDPDPSKPSVFLHGMSGSTLPVAVAHGEGRAQFKAPDTADALIKEGRAPIRYIDNQRQPTESYPSNPNGSPAGIAGVRSADGRVLAMMPHPERSVLAGCMSYIPPGKTGEWGEMGPWARMFLSARRWVG